MKQKKIENIIVGTALAVTASTLLPLIKSTLRPMAVTGVKGTLGAVERAKTIYQRAREEIEDIVAEAQFERMKKQMDQEIAQADPEKSAATNTEKSADKAGPEVGK